MFINGSRPVFHIDFEESKSKSVGNLQIAYQATAWNCVNLTALYDVAEKDAVRRLPIQQEQGAESQSRTDSALDQYSSRIIWNVHQKVISVAVLFFRWKGACACLRNSRYRRRYR